MTFSHGRSANSDRRAAVAAVAYHLCRIDLDHPIRVAVDGITASGKTTLATELTEAVADRGRPAVHLTMDGFHHHRERRHRQGRLSAAGYYDDAYDFDALIEHVLRPLGPGGHRHYRRSVIDLTTDLPTADATEIAAPDTVLIVDGTFLQRDPVGDQWDATIFVDTDFQVARERGIERDHAHFGGRAQTAEAFDLRYHAASRRYLDEVDPAGRATYVFQNDDVDHPVVRRGDPEN